MNPYSFAGLPPEKQVFVACKVVPDYTPISREQQLDAAIQVVAEIYGVKVSQVKNPPDRRMMFVQARSMVMFYFHLRGWTATAIGRALGRNHASVLHSIRNFKNSLSLKRCPERIGFTKMLFDMGHLPLQVSGTIAGGQYLDEIYDSEKYETLLSLSPAYLDLLTQRRNASALKARLKGDVLEEPSSYHKRWQQDPLNNLYYRKHVA